MCWFIYLFSLHLVTLSLEFPVQNICQIFTSIVNDLKQVALIKYSLLLLLTFSFTSDWLFVDPGSSFFYMEVQTFCFLIHPTPFRSCCRPTPVFTPDGETSSAARYTPSSDQHLLHTLTHTPSDSRPSLDFRKHLKHCQSNYQAALLHPWRLLLLLLFQVRTRLHCLPVVLKRLLLNTNICGISPKTF